MTKGLEDDQPSKDAAASREVPPPLSVRYFRARATSQVALWRERVYPPVPVEFADVGRVRDLEEAASVGVDGIDVALLVICVPAEGDLPPVRRPDRVETADRGRVGERATTGAGDRELPQAGAARVDDPDRAVVITVWDVGREDDLVPPAVTSSRYRS